MLPALVFLLFLRAAAAALLSPFAARDGLSVDAIPGVSVPARYVAIRELLGREVKNCDIGFHNCADIRQEGECCPNDRTCFWDSINKKTSCCAVGVKCPESRCELNSFECNETTTVTEAGKTSTIVEPNCCPRRCTKASFFMCPTPLWAKPGVPVCCGYSSICGASGSCLFTTPASSSSTGARTTTSGGATGSGSGSSPTSSTDPNEIFEQPHDPGLSTGAKAGIGAGVAIGASLIIGAATYLCVRQRRRAASSRGRGSVVTYTNGGRSGPRTGPLSLGSGFSSAGRHDTFPHSGPTSGGVGSGAMSETTDGRGGLTTDYFGPNAVSGPLTDVEGTGARGSAGTSPGLGVPVNPLHPDHIVAPVEIDSKETPIREGGANGRPNDGSRRVSYYGNTGVHESIDGRFELYSESPPPAFEASQAAYQGQPEQVSPQPEGVQAVEDEVGTMQTEAAPFLPRDAAASPRSLSPRDNLSPRSVSPVDPPSGHSNNPPGQGHGGTGGAQSGTTS